jgi:hypothetical protein
MRSIALFASAIVLYVLFHCTLCVFDKSHPSKCFSYGDRSLFHPHIRNSVNGIYCKMAGAYSKPFNISLFWYYIKQIMNVFIRAMVRIFSFGERWNGMSNDRCREPKLTVRGIFFHARALGNSIKTSFTFRRKAPRV